MDGSALSVILESGRKNDPLANNTWLVGYTRHPMIRVQNNITKPTNKEKDR